jgi:hypothetical protein
MAPSVGLGGDDRVLGWMSRPMSIRHYFLRLLQINVCYVEPLVVERNTNSNQFQLLLHVLDMKCFLSRTTTRQWIQRFPTAPPFVRGSYSVY